MAERKVEIAPFGGLVTAVDESVISPNSASDMNNVTVRDGRIRTRFGHSSIATALASVTNMMGSEFVRGYDDSYVSHEAILQFLDVGGTRKPYSVSLAGTRTEITNGGSPVSLDSGNWTALSFNGKALAFKRGGPVFEHQIGTATSFSALDVSPPASLTGATSVSFETTEDLSTNTPAGNIDWSTVTGAEFDTADATTFTGVSGTSFDVSPNATAVQTFTMELPGGPLDYTAIEDGSLSIIITGGTRGTGFTGLEIAFLDAADNVLDLDVSFTLSGGLTSKTASVTFSVPTGFDLSGFDDVDRIRITFSAIAYVVFGGNFFYPTPSSNVRIGEVTLTTSDPMGSGDPSISGSPERMRFGIAPFDDKRGQESAEVLPSPWFKLDSGPTRYFSDGSVFLGNIPTIPLPAPTSPADNHRIYVQFESQNVWRLVGTTDETEYETQWTSAQFKELPERLVIVREPVGNVLCATAHSGFVAWGKAGGKGNLKLSAIGDPAKLSSDFDLIEDETRGATFTLADDFADEPKSLVSSDVSLYIGGSRGLYALIGNAPSNMTPPKRFPGSSGVYGPRSMTRWRDESGNPGCVYLDTEGKLWLAQVVNGISEFGLRLSRMDLRIEGLITSWLLYGGSGVDAEKVSVRGDFENDSLWLSYRGRALVLRAPSVSTGNREWEAYTYATEWNRVIEDDKLGLIAVAADSKVHRLDSGSTDGGSAISSPYWQSREYSGSNRKLDRVEIERDDMTKPVQVTAISERATTTKTITANDRFTRFWINQQGFRHKVKVTLSDVTAVVNRLVMTERGPSGKSMNK